MGRIRGGTVADPMPHAWLVAALRSEADTIDAINRRPSLELRAKAWREHAANLGRLADECQAHAEAVAREMEVLGREGQA